MDIYKTIKNTINQYQMTAPGMHVIAAVSGGADSVCLLLALKELSKELGITVEAFHLHHGLRGAEADRDADFVRDLCAGWHVPATVRYADVKAYGEENGLSLEEAGRRLRYEILDELIKDAEKRTGRKTVGAAAHHMGDSAETILHNLFRGSGLKGLKGIPPVREGLIRPLIGLKREEIEEFLISRGISWCEDSTNRENEYTRNKLRNHILPAVRKEINQEAEAHIIQAGRLIAMADDFLEKTADGLWEKWGRKDSGSCCSFPIDIMSGQEEIIQYYLIRRMTLEAGKSMKDVTYLHIQAVQRLLQAQTGKQADLPGRLQARKGYERLYLEKMDIQNREDEPDAASLKGRMHFEIFSYKKDGKIPKNQYTKWFDYDKMKNTPCLRFRKPGDYITLTGGGRKSIKSFMIDEKIPRDIRGEIPLLADGDHIIWIVGYRISEYYKITEDTKTVLEAVYAEGGKNGGEDTGIIE